MVEYHRKWLEWKPSRQHLHWRSDFIMSINIIHFLFYNLSIFLVHHSIHLSSIHIPHGNVQSTIHCFYSSHINIITYAHIGDPTLHLFYCCMSLLNRENFIFLICQMNKYCLYMYLDKTFSMTGVFLNSKWESMYNGIELQIWNFVILNALSFKKTCWRLKTLTAFHLSLRA